MFLIREKKIKMYISRRDLKDLPLACAEQDRGRNGQARGLTLETTEGGLEMGHPAGDQCKDQSAWMKTEKGWQGRKG